MTTSQLPHQIIEWFIEPLLIDKIIHWNQKTLCTIFGWSFNSLACRDHFPLGFGCFLLAPWFLIILLLINCFDILSLFHLKDFYGMFQGLSFVIVRGFLQTTCVCQLCCDQTCSRMCLRWLNISTRRGSGTYFPNQTCFGVIT